MKSEPHAVFDFWTFGENFEETVDRGKFGSWGSNLRDVCSFKVNVRNSVANFILSWES
ncbi:hypothetical protein LEP1GSC040_3482 [Leptospira santarosai str. 2000030832]|nr:hypothetical protein LEP1GSC040_3482 [Leptospira santarosai str. 2000030832]